MIILERTDEIVDSRAIAENEIFNEKYEALKMVVFYSVPHLITFESVTKNSTFQ